MDSALYANYLNILKQELVPALGCTEPIAIAYAAAKAHQVLGEFPDSVNMSLSGNIIKNVKGVTVPNSGGLKGIDVAAILGIVGGNGNSVHVIVHKFVYNFNLFVGSCGSRRFVYRFNTYFVAGTFKTLKNFLAIRILYIFSDKSIDSFIC